MQWSGLWAPDPQDDAVALLSLRSARSPPEKRRPTVAWSAVGDFSGTAYRPNCLYKLPSHNSKTVLSIVKIGPLEEDRTAHKHRGVKDHTSPNHIAKRKFLPSLRSDIHDTGIASPRCVDRLPSHISKMVVSTVSGGGPFFTIDRTVFEMWLGSL